MNKVRIAAPALLTALLIASIAKGQRTLKVWQVEDYQIALIEHEQVREYSEQWPFRQPSEADKRATMRQYSITRNGAAITQGGYLQVSVDSCALTFLEYTEGRPRDGHVADKVVLNLCRITCQRTAVVKPTWRREMIEKVTLQPLDSVFHNPYNPHMPYRVTDYNDGAAVPLHPKMIDAFPLFFENSYIISMYIESDFYGHYRPHFKLTIYEKDKTSTVLFYWASYIVDGYMYGGGVQYGAAEDLHFWESNLKLLKASETGNQ